MFKGKQLPPGMYATTAANADESSWGTASLRNPLPFGDSVWPTF